jgi:alpha-glucosidase
MLRRSILRFAPVVFFAAAGWAQEDVVTVVSPNGRIVFRLFDGPPPTVDTQLPHLAYQVDYDGQRLIDTSYLGFEIFSQVPLGQKLGLVRTFRDAVDETYWLPAGKANPVRNHHNEVIAQYLQNGSLGRMLTLEVRVFDDGVAFRYVVPPSPPLLEMQIENELTEFHFARDGETYPLILRGFETAYADEYQRRTLSGIHPEALIGLPFLVEQPGVAWVAVTEADVKDYAGMFLMHTGGRRMQARLAPRVDGSGLAVLEKTPLVTPWRVLLIADRPEQLLESNLLDSLAAPSKLTETSWVRPGRMLRAAAAEARAAIQFAGEHGIEHVLLGEDWSKPGARVPDLLDPAIDVAAVAALGRAKQVAVWLAAPWRAVESQMEEAFARFARWGVGGVRVEGLTRRDQEAIAVVRTMAARAAEHRLMLSLEGASLPDGLRRSFPNVLTHGAVLGSEQAQWGARVTPAHNVLLAYTRQLAGPMNYAPGGFRNARPEEFQPGQTLGTRAHQLALFVVFESPLATLAGVPEDYRGQPEFDFVSQVPVVWAETRGVAGQVGEFVAVARRNGREWYLGAITNGTARDLELPLGFLGAGEYVAEVWSDADTPRRTRLERLRVSAAMPLRVRLAAGGGVAVRFRPAE